MPDNEDDSVEAVGDPVCWLSRVCPACGAIPYEGKIDYCRMPSPKPADCLRLTRDDRISR